jgi:phosphoribosylamine--glycine ligase
LDGVREFLEELNDYVIKADGLMGGKGVKVSGDHLKNIDEGFAYCKELIEKDFSFVIEEKFIGQEFSLMSFLDGKSATHMPVVQDHKRAFADDKGPNTGGMGAYSCSNHCLPFLLPEEVKYAQKINEEVMRALFMELGEEYKGILYGGFMATKNGIKVIEYNARFGDPEVMNVLSILETDFVEICEAIIFGRLSEIQVNFSPKATVCKYLVPEGYPTNPVKGKKIDISDVEHQDNLFFAAVDIKEGELVETGSRTLAFVAKADSIYEAEKDVEEQIQKVKGPLFHREDIGTKELIDKRNEAMRRLRYE